MELESYLKRASDIYFGLTTQDFRRLAFEFAASAKLNMPDKWVCTRTAGVDWLKGFLTRHPSLSIRKPQVYNCFYILEKNVSNIQLHVL